MSKLQQISNALKKAPNISIAHNELDLFLNADPEFLRYTSVTDDIDLYVHAGYRPGSTNLTVLNSWMRGLVPVLIPSKSDNFERRFSLRELGRVVTPGRLVYGETIGTKTSIEREEIKFNIDDSVLRNALLKEALEEYGKGDYEDDNGIGVNYDTSEPEDINVDVNLILYPTEALAKAQRGFTPLREIRWELKF